MKHHYAQSRTCGLRFLVGLSLVFLLASAGNVFAGNAKIRPDFAADIGPFVTLHYLDHTALNNYVDKFGMDPFDEMTLGGGLGSRILAGPVQFSSYLEGWSAKTSGKGNDAGIWGLSLVGRLGFTLIRRTFLSVLYFGPGLDYTELNINVKQPAPDFSGWKMGLLGDAGLSFEYLFPVRRGSKKETSYSAMNIPIGVQAGYSGEIISDPWYKRTGNLDCNQVRDRFMGWYIRFGLNIGGGHYSSSGDFFEFPEDDDLWPKTPKKKKRAPEPPPEEDQEDDEGGGRALHLGQ